MAANQPLLTEYEKVIDLAISEVRTTWELAATYGVVQVGLVSAFAVIYSKNLGNLATLPYWILSLAGFVSSLVWGLMFIANRMWRDNWLILGLEIERQLSNMGLRLDIFETERRLRRRKQARELFYRCESDDRPEIRFRDQKFYEKGFRVAMYGMIISGAIWLIAFFCFTIFLFWPLFLKSLN